MVWSFSFSLWVVNGAYVSNYNASLYREPDIIEIDDCGPANLISAGFALWLVLVPAVACVVQLPGSLVLYRRSNFYRFSPELGLVETLAVLSLLTKALWKGYRWDESIAAVFAVRDGIGQGDLWWRKDLEAMFPADEVADVPDVANASDQDLDETSSDHREASVNDGVNDADAAEEGEHAEDAESVEDAEGSEDLADVGDAEVTEDAETTAEVEATDPTDDDSDTLDDRIRDYLNSKLAPRLEPLSQERVLGAGLFLVAFIKIIAMVKASINSGVRLSCYLALAYSTSYIILEFLTWSYIFPLRHNSLRNVPPENLLDVIKYVDPGNNPFTFPSELGPKPNTTSIPLGSISPQSQTPLSLSSQVFRPYPGSAEYPWNKSIAIITATLGFLGPLTWLVVLSNILHPAYGAVIISCAAVGFLLARLGGKWVYHILRQTLLRPKPQQPSSGRSRNSISSQANANTNTATADPESGSETTIPTPPRDPFVQYNTHGIIHFFTIWLWRRITVVNLYSAIWVAVICYYFARIFPVKAGLVGDSPEAMVPQKPRWLDWLG
ncbi:uncharacterized protein BDZ99DRAFT_475235 [Mytilinidion resinicola]|uniref:Uncharacterized protein n=1 Tax=Mytilinidion resinicola TaxID=574789 RepID=A0A6A6YUK4_9PEZI|nr:uncharacterized protein BDZ99DRAFT_475235 [Mytilinidion resinicola]KAF2811714.1 hypothetical protein BDZ99DRAFT_475235 [Mytilinidion resinicola]